MSRKILVADDEYAISRSLAFMLKKEGYQCRTAADGIEALALMREDPPDLVILDLDMPGKDGSQVCREMREDERLRSVRCVVLTAKGEPLTGDWKERTLADDILFKPFEPRMLLRYIRRLFGEDAGAAP